MLEQFSVLVPQLDPEGRASSEAGQSSTPLVGGLRRFVDQLQDHLHTRFRAVPLTEWEVQTFEYVLLNAGPDPAPALELWDNPRCENVFNKVIPVCCGPGQGIQAMQRFPLPGFVEFSGFVAALNDKRPKSFSGLITRIETARRLGFDYLVGLHGTCALTVEESLPNTLARFILALQEQGSQCACPGCLEQALSDSLFCPYCEEHQFHTHRHSRPSDSG